MRVRLLAIGTRMPDWVTTGYEEYARRLAGDVRLELEEIPLPKRGKGDAHQCIADEAKALQKRLDKYPGILRVALEVGGRRIDTHGLSDKLATLRDQGQDMAILVGGPDGLDPALSKSCDERWSLSDLTLPHPLVRILVAEQVYRAWTLMTGHPYHR
ncbi:MAG: 23S rRNA (pseudouridine(1915)-N(3))-methyltransferase RlmH [Gammaproteobacteria bacterium]|nr:23S rRNA (pseudouridine(1915)-N(3))-methyltransferase RlmH [Gammaproteobacteria bacterium]MBQ0774570.1 23S rRNA (pseudouridine(1915)-N(3))-methyltransferase RlmH [Gammaproteobacteria bacterium]